MITVNNLGRNTVVYYYAKVVSIRWVQKFLKELANAVARKIICRNIITMTEAEQRVLRKLDAATEPIDLRGADLRVARRMAGAWVGKRMCAWIKKYSILARPKWYITDYGREQLATKQAENTYVW
jgi:hypothetical protein